MKIGVEAEGRLKGLTTLFLNESELSPAIVQKVVDLRKGGTWVQQVYVSDLDNRLDLKTDERLRALAPQAVVTVERTYIAERPPTWLCVVLRIVTPSFWELRSIDQIKFEENLHVFMFSVEQAFRTPPEAFSKDKVLE